MPADVTFEHPSYITHRHQVELVNTIYNGIDTAKSLVSKLNNEYQDLFDIRVEEATLDNFIERICQSMSGQVMRKPISYEEVPQNIVDSMDTISGQDNINQFSKDLTLTAIRDGKAFVLVDAPVDGGTPYFSMIERSQVTNWRKDDDDVYTMVVILETYTVPDGYFGFEVKEQYRVIDEVGNVQIWRAGENKNVWTVVEEITTSYNFCPFYELYIDDIPPLYDIAKINVKHLNFTSLRDRFTRNAMDPILFGQNLDITDEGSEDKPTIIIGVDTMMNTDNDNSNLSWVEMDGTNYDVTEKLLLKLEDDMGAMALKLQSDSNEAKTATQVSTDNKEGTARLNDIATSLEQVLQSVTNAFSLITYNKEVTGDILVNRDFNSSAIDGNTLTSLNTLQVSNNLSRRTLLKAVNESELVTIEDIDDELAAIEEENLLMLDERVNEAEAMHEITADDNKAE